MELKNCPECGKLYVHTERSLCPECVRREDDHFELVRRFLRDEPEATVGRITEATGVAETVVLRLLRHGRLTLPEGSPIGLYCERCDAPIAAGRLCTGCRKELAAALAVGGVPPRAADRPGEGRGDRPAQPVRAAPPGGGRRPGPDGSRSGSGDRSNPGYLERRRPDTDLRGSRRRD